MVVVIGLRISYVTVREKYPFNVSLQNAISLYVVQLHY
jgi:hypothetical protein